MKHQRSIHIATSRRRCQWFVAGFASASILAALALAEGSKLTPPPDLTEAEAIEEKVQSAESLPPEAKAEIQQQFASTKAQFQQLWAPLEDAYAKRLSDIQNWQRRWDDRSRRGQAHDSTPHQFKLPDEQGAFNAYNAERDRLMTESEALKQEKTRMDQAWKDEWAAKAKPYDEWRARGAFGKFKQVAQAMLDGKIRFKKGKAWDQLVEAAKGAGNAHAVFENSPANVVDTHGVQPWAPGEREKELLKPRVQPYFQSKSAAPPPPPPPSP